MTDQHTPGPWLVYAKTVTVGCDNGYDVTANGNYVRVAQSCNEANARLIAAAPELLELLEEALDNDEACEGFNESNMSDSLRQKIKTAIARAKGLQ